MKSDVRQVFLFLHMLVIYNYLNSWVKVMRNISRIATGMLIVILIVGLFSSVYSIGMGTDGVNLSSSRISINFPNPSDQWNQTVNNFFLVADDDWTDPVIANIVQYPNNPTMTDPVTINATLSDLSGISSASVYYRIDSGVWFGVTMDNIDGDIYQATIGPAIDGGYVQYFLTATDASLNHNIAINDNGGLYFHFTCIGPDIEGPVIELLPRNPQNPTALDSVIIRANITDAHEIRSVILSYYTSESPSQTNITMNFEGAFYRCVIPSVNENVVVTYKIIAYDIFENCEISDTQSYTVIYAMAPSDILFGAITITSILVSIIGLFVITSEIRKRRISS
ncbi:MAG: hypothetical protein ACTSV2_19110 [Candidatus Thorarchaeota archaeon]